MVSSAVIERLQSERRELEAFAQETLDAALAEERDLSQSEMESLTRTETRMKELDEQIKPLVSFIERKNSAIQFDAKTVAAQTRRETAVQAAPAGVASFGAAFVDSDEFRSYRGVGNSGIVTIDGSVSELRAGPLSTSNDPGQIMLPSNQKYMLPQPTFQTPLLDIVGRLPVSTNSVDLIVYGSPKGATGADIVAEGSDKPEAEIVGSKATISVDTVAYWIDVTRQLLEDAPAIRGLIDTQLRRGLLFKVEALIKTAIEAGSYAPTNGAAGQDLIEVARLGMATVQEAGYRPNALLCSPQDAAKFDLHLLQQTQSGAILGAPVWGLNIVPVAGLTKPLLGDFSTGVHLLERTGTNVYVTDSNKDNFTKNIFTILAELRAAAHVVQADAITELVVS